LPILRKALRRLRRDFYDGHEWCGARGGDGWSGWFARGMIPGKFHIDMSTVSPEVSRALAAKVREKGADMIDAPVSGSVITLQQGKLSVMVGGRKETFEHLKPLLL
jgi:3-hydroxyisobutyrate dehydrogenase-like beta-hydroxyacid dehydrogenase